MKTKCLVAKNFSFGTPDVLTLIEEDIPAIQDDEFLVQGLFSSVSVADVRLRSKDVPKGFKLIMSLIFGFKKPKYDSLGTDYCGIVCRVGPKVTDLRIGDRIVADLGMQLNGSRTHRKFRQKDVWTKVPDQVLSQDAAASIFGGVTALIFLRDKLQIRDGESVLIIGAGGAVGSSALQIAKHYGAKVTAVCSHKKTEKVKSLGADTVINYENSNWTESVGLFDVILDTSGKVDIQIANKVLTPKGRVGFVVADLMLNITSAFRSIFSKRTYRAGAIESKITDIEFLIKLIQSQELKPLIGQVYPLTKIKEAHVAAGSGHKLGTILIDYQIH